ncbi:MAG: hypothetical protein MJK12_03035 [Colwellia sp.]|nr:hypothetical protein [Colwellia sp.]
MDYFKDLADESEKKAVEDFMPEWASKNNASYSAYRATVRLKGERILYINKHSKLTHFKTKKTYHIAAREVARAIDIAISTLITSSTYSEDYSGYLGKVNKDLADLKDKRIFKSKQSYSRGPIARSKDMLVEEVRQLKSAVKSLEEKNAIEQVKHAINMLHPDVAELLILEQQPQFAKITRIGKK